jgi:nucleoside-diphosphate-sugar epimerase
MKILITGGMGFIGLHLVDYLLKKGNKIIVLDNFSNSNKNLIKKIQNKNLRIIEGDIRKIDDIVNSMENQEVVIHLAAKISVNESIENPNETFDVNVNGTKNVLKACKKNNIKKLIVASSAAVYGENTSQSKLKEISKTNPISPYGESKLLMENEINKFQIKNSNLKCIILRFFNIFGKGQSSEYAGVITKFIEKISTNESIEIFGDGLQERDFISVDDVIESILNAIKNGTGGTYNIGSGKTTTINDLAKVIISISKKNIKISHLSPKKGDIKFSGADITLAKNEIKYSPKFNLEKIKELL